MYLDTILRPKTGRYEYLPSAYILYIGRGEIMLSLNIKNGQIKFLPSVKIEISEKKIITFSLSISIPLKFVECEESM